MSVTLAGGVINWTAWRRSPSRVSRVRVFMVKFLSVWLAHLDLFRFCFLGFGQCHLENSILIGGTDPAGVHTCREGNAAAECADIALTALSCFSVVALAFALAFAANRQRAIVQRNIDIFLTHSGQLDDGHKMIAAVVKIERG